MHGELTLSHLGESVKTPPSSPAMQLENAPQQREQDIPELDVPANHHGGWL